MAFQVPLVDGFSHRLQMIMTDTSSWCERPCPIESITSCRFLSPRTNVPYVPRCVRTTDAGNPAAFGASRNFFATIPEVTLFYCISRPHPSSVTAANKEKIQNAVSEEPRAALRLARGIEVTPSSPVYIFRAHSDLVRPSPVSWMITNIPSRLPRQ